MNKNGTYENDDLVTFQHNSRTVNLYYSQFVKYSKRARDKYLFPYIVKQFPQELHQFQEKYQLSSDNIFYFFQLLQQNYNINENLNLTYMQCIDLHKLSKYLEVRKLSDFITEYIKEHKTNIDFIIQMIEYENKTREENDETEFVISKEIENLLANKIDECFSNKKFANLPISNIYRIVKTSSTQKITNDKLLDFIKKSVSKFCVLFSFVDLQKLSENRLDEICELYLKSDEVGQHYFDYLRCNLNIINEMKLNRKILEERLKTSEKNEIYQKSKVEELENQIKQLHKQLEEAEDDKINLQKQLKDEKYPIKGQIVASVKNGLLISAKISLTVATSEISLDTGRSKYIVAASNAECLGADSYEKGEPITSLEIDTKDFLCKPGTYCVRCIVFDIRGRSNEIVSNSVTTSGESVLFGFEGEVRTISLLRGEYKLEVWGAKGGDSTGARDGMPPGIGGLGGYSHGVLKLEDSETVHVVVGGEGRPADSSEGATTSGGFPDGGGTQTGIHSYHTSVPGTGGGSTSIGIGGNTNYSRVIVAGGGGGAGSSTFTNCGGFGGGASGGCCYQYGSPLSCGSGTQAGSTGGCGTGSNGDPGRFGEGAAGKYMPGCFSGGGGGGGWYGGGGGGCGKRSRAAKYFAASSSGGGGSGWVFTASSLSAWEAGDRSAASKFELGSSYFLSDAASVGGNEEFPCPDGNGRERGHAGNGWARITPVQDCETLS